MSKFYRKLVIIEEVPAWEKCGNCNGFGERNVGDKEWIVCFICNGACGIWHSNVLVDPGQLVGNLMTGLPNVVVDRDTTIAKSDTLIREHEVCRECHGEGKIQTYNLFIKACGIDCPVCHGEHISTACPAAQKNQPKRVKGEQRACSHCLKDAEGKPTGAEPGTAGEWRVKG